MRLSRSNRVRASRCGGRRTTRKHYLGPTTLRVGIEKSRNRHDESGWRTASAWTRSPITRQRFGVVDKLQPVLAMALGAGETTVLRMTTAYSMIVNGGKNIVPTFIDRVQDHTGKTVFKHDTRPCAGCSDIQWSPDLAVPDVPMRGNW